MPHSHDLLHHLVHHLVHHFDRAFELEALAWVHVQLQGDDLQCCLTVPRQVCALGCHC